MKITEHIKKAKGKTKFTFETLPPIKGHSIQSIYENIDPLMEFNPPFIDVTYHREEVVLNEKEKYDVISNDLDQIKKYIKNKI